MRNKITLLLSTILKSSLMPRKETLAACELFLSKLGVKSAAKDTLIREALASGVTVLPLPIFAALIVQIRSKRKMSSNDVITCNDILFRYTEHKYTRTEFGKAFCKEIRRYKL